MLVLSQALQGEALQSVACQGCENSQELSRGEGVTSDGGDGADKMCRKRVR